MIEHYLTWGAERHDWKTEYSDAQFPQFTVKYCYWGRSLLFSRKNRANPLFAQKEKKKRNNANIIKKLTVQPPPKLLFLQRSLRNNGLDLENSSVPDESKLSAVNTLYVILFFAFSFGFLTSQRSRPLVFHFE